QFLDGLAPEPRHVFWRLQLPDSVQGGPDHVDGVVGSRRFGQDVSDPRHRQHIAHRTAGDHSGTFGGGLHQDATAPELADHFMRDGRSLKRDTNHILLGFLNPLPDRFRHLRRFSDPAPTIPFPSPTTTKALKLNRLPPLTTLATRLMFTTFSISSGASVFIGLVSLLKSQALLPGHLRPGPSPVRGKDSLRGRRPRV